MIVIEKLSGSAVKMSLLGEWMALKNSNRIVSCLQLSSSNQVNNDKCLKVVTIWYLFGGLSSVSTGQMTVLDKYITTGT